MCLCDTCQNYLDDPESCMDCTAVDDYELYYYYDDEPYYYDGEVEDENE